MNLKRALTLGALATLWVGNQLLIRSGSPVDAAWRISSEYGYTAEGFYLKSASYRSGLLSSHCTVELRSRAEVPGLDSSTSTAHEQATLPHQLRGAQVTIQRSSGFTDWKLTNLEKVD